MTRKHRIPGGKRPDKHAPEPAPSANGTERLHKVLATSGLGSRRALEERIANGEVQVNGRQAVPGTPVKIDDRVEIDGKGYKVVARSNDSRLLIYNKPEGELITRSDPEGRPTVFERLPRIHDARWVAIGRLDINTSGLLLLTDDGELANAMMHPSYEVEREYLCRVHGQPDDACLERLRKGVKLEDGMARFDEIEPMGTTSSHQWFQVVIKEGRNREVRRLWEHQGFEVSRLKRVRYGDITLPRLLRRGHAEELSAAPINKLRKSLGLAERAEQLALEPDARIRRVQRQVRAHSGDPAQRRAFVTPGHKPRRPRAAEDGKEFRRSSPDRAGGRRDGAPRGRKPAEEWAAVPSRGAGAARPDRARPDSRGPGRPAAEAGPRPGGSHPRPAGARPPRRDQEQGPGFRARQDTPRPARPAADTGPARPSRPAPSRGSGENPWANAKPRFSRDARPDSKPERRSERPAQSPYGKPSARPAPSDAATRKPRTPRPAGPAKSTERPSPAARRDKGSSLPGGFRIERTLGSKRDSDED